MEDTATLLDAIERGDLKLAHVNDAGRLELAALLIESVRAKLDTGSQTCGCCGIEAKRNLEEFRAHRQLGGVITSLRKVVGLLKFNPNGSLYVSRPSLPHSR